MKCFKSKSGRIIILLLILLILVVVFGLLKTKPKIKPVLIPQEINILWAEWKPSDYFQELTKDFTTETGIKVNIVQESWGTLQDRFFNEMEKKGDAEFDMVIGDSQWLGRGVADGHYVEISKWFLENEIDKKMTNASVVGYCEYPKGSKHFWAVPVEGDAMGFVYRKDLFENPKEKEAFRIKYGYELDIPKTWLELKDIAQFFYRPKNNFYGILVWTEPLYDGITMGVDSLLWAWGADIGNLFNYHVKGVLNSPEGVAALKFYKELYQYSNPAWSHYGHDADAHVNQPLIDGQVVMTMEYFAISPELLDPSRNPYSSVVGFFAFPKGPKMSASSLGGQGISIVSYTKKKNEAFKFLEWFIRDDVQKKWAQLGGLSCSKSVLYSEEFLNASPINKPFVESMEMVKDFWTVPEYTDLLAISQKYWYQYVVEGGITGQQAMDSIAREWEEIFEIKGYYKE